jgi:hypothetical protein
MKILKKIPDHNEKYLLARYQATFYPISAPVDEFIKDYTKNKTTTILFSGGYRLNIDGTFIEPSMFSRAKIDWKPNTLFIDPANLQLIEYCIKKINSDVLCIINSTLWIQYQDWQAILDNIKKCRKLTKNILVTLPLNRFDFNRLKYSYEKIADELGGVVIDDTIVICQ